VLVYLCHSILLFGCCRFNIAVRSATAMMIPMLEFQARQFAAGGAHAENIDTSAGIYSEVLRRLGDAKQSAQAVDQDLKLYMASSGGGSSGELDDAHGRGKEEEAATGEYSGILGASGEEEYGFEGEEEEEGIELLLPDSDDEEGVGGGVGGGGHIAYPARHPHTQQGRGAGGDFASAYQQHQYGSEGKESDVRGSGGVGAYSGSPSKTAQGHLYA
jgi:hypothetical protein